MESILRVEKEKIRTLESELSKQKINSLDYFTQTKKLETKLESGHNLLISETSHINRLHEKIKESESFISQYKIEIEELIKQLDASDSWNKSLQDEISALKNEVRSSERFRQARIEFKENKAFERALEQEKRTFELEKIEWSHKCDELEIDINNWKDRAIKAESQVSKLMGDIHKRDLQFEILEKRGLFEKNNDSKEISKKKTINQNEEIKESKIKE